MDHGVLSEIFSGNTFSHIFMGPLSIFGHLDGTFTCPGQSWGHTQHHGWVSYLVALVFQFENAQIMDSWMYA